MTKPQPESIIKRHVFQYLSMQPEFFGFYAQTTGIYDPNRGVFRRRSGLGMPNGISDVIGLWRGQFVAIEVKTARGRVSPEQKIFQEDVIRKGGLAVVIRSVDEIVDWVTAIRLVASRSLGEA